jgi:hypothetical protein
MARTLNATLPISAYSVSSYLPSGLSGNNSNPITFTISLSVETASTLATYLSGNSLVATPSLSGTLTPTALSTLSAAALTAVNYFWGTSIGNTAFYATVASSSIIPSLSSWTATLTFPSLNMLTTVFNLSGNASSLVILSTSTTDNPLYDRSGWVVTNANETNSTFRTVSEHCRRWNYFG